MCSPLFAQQNLAVQNTSGDPSRLALRSACSLRRSASGGLLVGNDSTDAPQDERETKANERASFNAIAAVLEPLPEEARLRLIKLVAAFFDLSLSEGKAAASTEVVHRLSTPPPTTFSEDRSPTPKQFLLEKKAVTDIERIACLAYYLTHYRDTPYFKTLDLSKLNTEAAQIKLANPSKSSDNAMARGLLVQAGGGKRQISALGELYVQALPDREAARSAVAHAKPRRRAKPKPGSTEPSEVD
jgi:hypothetical protein